MSKLIQQGDVLIFTESELPEDATRVEPQKDRLTLALGESTGHSHTVNVLDYPGTELFKSSQGMFMRCNTSIEIVHQEHHKVKIPKGGHKIKLVQEVDPFTEEVRAVQD